MKIRTDFVTNSSSSSFTIAITADLENGKSLSVCLADEDGELNADFMCDAKSIANARSIDSLIKLLKTSLVLENCWDQDSIREEMNHLLDEIRRDCNSVKDIKKLTFERDWFAWGECASCFWWNIGLMAPGLEEAAKAVVDAKNPQEKEDAKKAMEKIINDFPYEIQNEAGDTFPSKFLGYTGPAEIDWSAAAGDIEEFAQKIVNQALASEDRAEEVTVIDMQTGEIVQTATYFAE